MIPNGIKIEWLIGPEFIALDFQSLAPTTVIAETLELRKKTGEVAKYNVDSVIERNGRGGDLIMTITYDDSKNTHIERNDFLWGRSTILIKANAKEGRAIWRGKYTDQYDGEAGWQRIEGNLLKPIKRETVSRAQREQQQLRAALLSSDCVCAITGEACPDVLDAAHIIPSKAGGAEVIENAILLRADLHRLFDSGRFAIDLSGGIVLKFSLPQHYKDLLEARQLPERIRSRVAGALAYLDTPPSVKTQC